MTPSERRNQPVDIIVSAPSNYPNTNNSNVINQLGADTSKSGGNGGLLIPSPSNQDDGVSSNAGGASEMGSARRKKSRTRKAKQQTGNQQNSQ
jgi:hypothetical protein